MLHELNEYVRLPSIALMAMKCLESCTISSHFTALGEIEGNQTQSKVAQEGNQIHLLDSNGTRCQVLYYLDINRRQSNAHLTLMAQDAKHCMVWRSIEGNRTHPLDSDGAVC